MIPVAVGSGHNVARAIQENNSHQGKLDTQSRLDNQARLAKLDSQRPAKQKKARICQIHSEPDAIIGSGVEIHGDFQFDKLVRIDGKFQGNLFSHNRGDIIVGKNGCIIGDVIVARRMIVEGGHVLGKVVVDELLLLDRTIIKGDVTCKLIQIVGPDVTITGRANIHPQAPELIDEYNNIITEVPKVFFIFDAVSSDNDNPSTSLLFQFVLLSSAFICCFVIPTISKTESKEGEEGHLSHEEPPKNQIHRSDQL